MTEEAEKSEKAEKSKWTIKLSHSARTTLYTCQRKWLFAKTHVEKDFDAPDDENLRFGSAVHHVLEHTNRVRQDQERILELTREAGEKYRMGHKLHGIYYCAQNYFDMHLKSGLECLYSEVRFDLGWWVGIVDEILYDNTHKVWWIGDTKTTGRAEIEKWTASLKFDPQMMTYAAFHIEIARVLQDPKIRPENFAGCRYRPTLKLGDTRDAEPLPEETCHDYWVRQIGKKIRGKVKAEKECAWDFVIEYGAGDIYKLRSDHIRHLLSDLCLAENIYHYRQIASRNYGSCMAWFRPCEYWSRCHGGRCYTNTKYMTPNTDVLYGTNLRPFKYVDEKITKEVFRLNVLNYLEQAKNSGMNINCEYGEDTTPAEDIL